MGQLHTFCLASALTQTDTTQHNASSNNSSSNTPSNTSSTTIMPSHSTYLKTWAQLAKQSALMKYVYTNNNDNNNGSSISHVHDSVDTNSTIPSSNVPINHKPITIDDMLSGLGRLLKEGKGKDMSLNDVISDYLSQVARKPNKTKQKDKIDSKGKQGVEHGEGQQRCIGRGNDEKEIIEEKKIETYNDHNDNGSTNKIDANTNANDDIDIDIPVLPLGVRRILRRHMTNQVGAMKKKKKILKGLEPKTNAKKSDNDKKDKVAEGHTDDNDDEEDDNLYEDMHLSLQEAVC